MQPGLNPGLGNGPGQPGGRLGTRGFNPRFLHRALAAMGWVGSLSPVVSFVLALGKKYIKTAPEYTYVRLYPEHLRYRRLVCQGAQLPQ